MNITKYRNFIIGDPILDILPKIGKYTPDNLLPNFDENLLLNTYISKNKKIFIKKIFEFLGEDAIRLSSDSFVMKTKNLHKHFENGHDRVGGDYSFFTIEYSSITTLKYDKVSSIHKYYNFKNWMLAKNSGYKLDSKYILGRKYNEHKNFNYLVFNPYSFDKLLIEAEQHLNNLDKKIIGVDVFPNMKNTSDYPWHNAKKIISERYKELSAISGISISDRCKLVSAGITSSSQIHLKRSEKFFENFQKLDLPDSKNIFFIDFEVLTSVYDTFEKFPESNTRSVLFNIGCCSKDSELSLMANCIEQERKIFEEFVYFLNKFNNVTLVHWTNIEKRIFNEKLNEFSIQLDVDINWFDFHEYFVKSDIYIENCPNYKLKVVSRLLEEKGVIKSKWDNGLFFDGLGAMTGYIKYLTSGDKSIIDEISKYNLVDCKVMVEIFDFVKSEL